MSAILPARLTATYPTARVRGRLITRLEERPLRWTALTAEAADEMGRERLGWFVGGHPGTARAAEQLGRLDANPEGGVWVVVPLGRDLSRELYARWPHPEHLAARQRAGDSVWRARKVWVAMPEDLKELLPLARAAETGVAGVIVLDPFCILHKARGGTDSWGKVHRNDRPQHVVDFCAALAADGWQPPLFLLTERPAKATDTAAVARAFCLSGFRFVAGDTFACWDAPIDAE